MRSKADMMRYRSKGEDVEEGISRHPVLVYKMVRQMALLKERIETSSEQTNLSNLTSLLPVNTDVTGAMDALLRLQETYNLNVSDMAEGVIAGNPSEPLTHEECLELGIQSSKENRLSQGKIWFDVALHKAELQSDKVKILKEKMDAEIVDGMKQSAIKTADELLKIDKDNHEVEKLRNSLENRHLQKRPGRFFISEAFDKLCRGDPVDNSKNDTELSKLKCRYFNNNRHPLLLISPARQEDVHSDPYIVIYRDFISDNDSKILKNYVKGSLQVSKVNTVVDGAAKPSVSWGRVSKGVFIHPQKLKTVRKIQTRVNAITSLRINTFEPLQVANYGIGGFFFNHYDWSRANNMYFDRQDRIATLMMYLNDVETGGATVFTEVGVRVTPSKGDAVFWINLYRNGLGRRDTMHAGCPVAMGTKWVANQWIGRQGNEFTLPCALEKNL